MSSDEKPKGHNLVMQFKDRHEFKMIRQAYFFVIGFDYSRHFIESIETGNGRGSKQYLKFTVSDNEKAQILAKYNEIKKRFERSQEKAFDNLLTDVMTDCGVMPQEVELKHE